MINNTSRTKRRTLRTIAVALLATTTIAACGGGTETSSSTKSSTDSTVKVKNAALAAPCTTGNACRVGDPGMSGGTVFYVLDQPLNCGGSIFNAQCNEWEVAPSNWAVGNLPTDSNLNRRNLCTTGANSIDIVCKWNNGTSNVNGALSPRFGYGLYNWMKARAIASVELTASFNAAGYTPASYTNDATKSWFLPSKEELIALCNFANGSAASTTTCTPGTLKSTFAADWYWSSSSTSNGSLISSVWAVNFKTGEVAARTLGSTGYVRPIFGNKGVVNTAPPTTTLPPTTTTTTTIPATCAAGGACSVGNVGPGGGTVIYVASTPFSCGDALASKCKYIEIAPANWSSTPVAPCSGTGLTMTCPWPFKTFSAPSTKIELGTGMSNTVAMLSFSGDGAAKTIRSYTGGGKTDWFIPSAVEGNIICKWAHYNSDAVIADLNAPCQPGMFNKALKFSRDLMTSSDKDSDNVVSYSVNPVNGSLTANTPKQTGIFAIWPIREF